MEVSLARHNIQCRQRVILTMVDIVVTVDQKSQNEILSPQFTVWNLLSGVTYATSGTHGVKGYLS